MYGEPSGLTPPEWEWVAKRLATAPLYWVVSATVGWPHPRPVWGVWLGDRLCLSLGSPHLRRDLARDGRVTIHLESGTDVVIVEGRVADSDVTESVLAHYDEKYDFAYDVGRYGALLAVAPIKVMAWTAAGFAGRDGFTSGAVWTFVEDR
jgi:hypothetical protein